MKRVGPQDNPRVLNGSPASTGAPFRTRGLARGPRNACSSGNGRAATRLYPKGRRVGGLGDVIFPVHGSSLSIGYALGVEFALAVHAPPRAWPISLGKPKYNR